MTNTTSVPVPPDFYEKTLRDVAKLSQERAHNDTLHRFFGDVEAAIANLLVINDETAKERDAARADATRYALNETARAAFERALEAGR